MPIVRRDTVKEQTTVHVKIPIELDTEFVKFIRPLGHTRNSAVRVLIYDWVKEQRDKNKE